MKIFYLFILFLKILNDKCYLSWLNSFKLEGLIRPLKKNKSNTCKYNGKYCCTKNSDKLTQILWTRISNPRVKLKYKLSYFYIKKTIDNIANSIKFFINIKTLPIKEIYSIECLKTQNNLYKISNKNYLNKLYKFKNNIKNMFYTLHKLKKQFYCDICIYDFQQEFNLKKKTINFNYSLCYSMIKRFFNFSFFINIELNKLMNNIQNLYLCFLFKNIQNINKKFDYTCKNSVRKALNDCKDNLNNINKFDIKKCTNYCKHFNLIKDKEIIIGNVNKHKTFNKFYKFVRNYLKKYFKIDLDKDKLLKEDKLNYKKNIKLIFNSNNFNWKRLSNVIKDKFFRSFNKKIFYKTNIINKYLFKNYYNLNSKYDIFLKNKLVNLNIEKFKIKFSEKSVYDPFKNLLLNNIYFNDVDYNYLIEYNNFDFKNITEIDTNNILEKIVNNTVNSSEVKNDVLFKKTKNKNNLFNITKEEISFNKSKILIKQENKTNENENNSTSNINILKTIYKILIFFILIFN